MQQLSQCIAETKYIHCVKLSWARFTGVLLAIAVRNISLIWSSAVISYSHSEPSVEMTFLGFFCHYRCSPVNTGLHALTMSFAPFQSEFKGDCDSNSCGNKDAVMKRKKSLWSPILRSNSHNKQQLWGLVQLKEKEGNKATSRKKERERRKKWMNLEAKNANGPFEPPAEETELEYA